MANTAVKLYRKCKTPDGWKRYPAAMSANGKVKPNVVTIAGAEKAFKIGHYELRSFEGTKTVWTRLDGGATDALTAHKIAQRKSNARVEAKDAGLRVDLSPKRGSISDAVKRFVGEAKDRGSLEAAELYERSLSEFIDNCKKTYVDEIEHDDVARFHAAMRKRGMADRTIANRHSHFRAFLLHQGFDRDSIKRIAGPKPRYEKTLPEIYEPKELKAFFAALAEEYDQLLFDVLLTCGLREQEAMHLERSDLSASRSTLKVQSKPRYGFKVKDAEERELPVPSELMTRLLAYSDGRANKRLLFGGAGGVKDSPDGHLLRRLKGLARDAGLNCRECRGCDGKGECENWFLHKFRATYITTLLRNGLDLRTVMTLSGHSDLESVMRYLRPAEGDVVQAKVNSIKWR